jgi:hypothetical protein
MRTRADIRHLKEREHPVPCQYPGCRRADALRNDGLCDSHGALVDGGDLRWRG